MVGISKCTPKILVLGHCHLALKNLSIKRKDNRYIVVWKQNHYPHTHLDPQNRLAAWFRCCRPASSFWHGLISSVISDWVQVPKIQRHHFRMTEILLTGTLNFSPTSQTSCLLQQSSVTMEAESYTKYCITSDSSENGNVKLFLTEKACH